jgi:hypothetical protein
MMRGLVLITTLAVAACYNSPTGPDAAVGKAFDLKAGAVSTLPDGARLRFERVQSDSRCPMDVMCVWAGDATISVTLNPAKGATESRELHTQQTGSQISYANYTITLTALAPYPRSNQEIPASGYIATFVVSVR